MSEGSGEDDDAVLTEFLETYLADRERGVVRTLDGYLLQFPEHAETIAKEFLSLRECDAIGGGKTLDRSAQDIGRIGPYEIRREIGRGGQAVVYLAHDPRLDRFVAVKVLIGWDRASPEMLRRFHREARVASMLNDGSICQVYDTGIIEGVPFIAMQYVEGQTLAESIMASSSAPRTSAAINEILALFETAARAFHVAHERGVIHRDIKPGNIMIATSGNPIIVDFGLAQEVEGNDVSLTLPGHMTGTPAYMSPEQLTANRIRLDRRTDVYSLGVTLFETLTLERPFEAPTRDALYKQILTENPPDPRSANRSISSDLKVVVETALAKDLDRRYQTALDFAEDLRRVRAREPILAKPVSRLVRLERWAQRNPALAASVAALFIVLATGLGVALVLLGQRDRALEAKSAALSDYDRLGDVSRLDRLVADARMLWPCEPAKVPAMRAWVEQGTALAARLDGHRVHLGELRMAGLAAFPESSPGESRPADSRPTWQFTSIPAQFKHDTTERLVTELTAFVDPDPRKGLLAHVRARLAFSETVERETIGKYEMKWKDAILSIANRTECPKYGGLVIEPQLGLIPIGKDPASGLWEFAHLQTTAARTDPIPVRQANGRLTVTESMGLVFVLLPGGTFRMGATKPPDEETPLTDPNIDPEATPRESPVTKVTLDPFFLSKYEMTQGQWERLVGTNPSSYGPGRSFGGKRNLSNPVERITWNDCDLWLGRLGLVLPTEAQWEYGARGGTTTPRWTGLGTDALAKAANLADAFCREFSGLSSMYYESWNDGYALHSPVGSFAANPFGLHDVLGNVWESCRDLCGSYEVEPRAHDGLRLSSVFRDHVSRGGGWLGAASYARSACRNATAPDYGHFTVGVRPARSLSPSKP